jgi:aldehyde:ferredoxin oxidoreductase
MCFFAVVPPQTVVDLVNAATGQEWSLEDLIRIGERAWNLKRVINLRYGLTPAAEKLPKLLLEPLPDGGQEGHIPDMDLLLNEYYAACDWDRATGWPSVEKLAALGLAFVR